MKIKIITHKDLIEFDASSDAHKFSMKIIDSDMAEDFEKKVNALYPDGVEEDVLNKLIIAYAMLCDLKGDK